MFVYFVKKKKQEFLHCMFIVACMSHIDHKSSVVCCEFEFIRETCLGYMLDMDVLYICTWCGTISESAEFFKMQVIYVDRIFWRKLLFWKINDLFCIFLWTFFLMTLCESSSIEFDRRKCLVCNKRWFLRNMEYSLGVCMCFFFIIYSI